MRAFALALALMLAFAAVRPAAAQPTNEGAKLDRIAPDYVLLALRIGEHEPGYIDAYYGPPEYQARARKDKGTIPELRREADRLIAAVRAVDAGALKHLEKKRRSFFLAHLVSARARLDMIEGRKLPFRDEAAVILGYRPELKPLSFYDPILARIEKMVPGAGPLDKRVDAFRMRYVIPKERLDAVMRAGIAECRRRTAAHMKLPETEAFDLEFVTNKSWSGYNWYKGGYKSLIQINTDLPIFADRAVDLGCHEGYPGHHVHNMTLERNLLRRRGWPEMSVYPLYSPTSFISEGTGNYGIDMAFPGDTRTEFEARVIFPLAGLDPKTARANADLRKAIADLSNARATISADYLDGKIDREAAIRLVQKYQLVSRARAEQLIKFTEEYRSYVINYGLGQDEVKAHVERAGKAPAARWAAFEELIGEPTIPADFVGR